MAIDQASKSFSLMGDLYQELHEILKYSSNDGQIAARSLLHQISQKAGTGSVVGNILRVADTAVLIADVWKAIEKIRHCSAETAQQLAQTIENRIGQQSTISSYLQAHSNVTLEVITEFCTSLKKFKIIRVGPLGVEEVDWQKLLTLKEKLIKKPQIPNQPQMLLSIKALEKLEDALKEDYLEKINVFKANLKAALKSQITGQLEGEYEGTCLWGPRG